MVEPTRKRERPPLPPPDRKLEETKTFSLRFVTTHRTRPADIDLVEMATGTGNLRKGKGGGKSWVGGFSGRPALIEELLPHIHARIGASAKKPAKMMETNLRGCWRFLDRCETEGGVERASPVVGLRPQPLRQPDAAYVGEGLAHPGQPARTALLRQRRR